MDNLDKIKKHQAVERLLKTAMPKPEPTATNNDKILEEAFRVFAYQASQANPDSRFLEGLRMLTGHESVDEMVKRFRKLAGLK